jgi:hypothetical protein
MEKETCRADRLSHLEGEYQKGVQFHREEFSEIEGKVKYWLTFLFPASFALFGYLFQNDTLEDPSYFTAASVAILIVLVATIFVFALSLKTTPIKGGILKPDPPNLQLMEDYLKMEDETAWNDYKEREVQERLDAFAHNERANREKSAWLQRGQVLLFFGILAAPLCVAFVQALFNVCSNQYGFLGCPRFGICSGAFSGIIIVGLLIFIDHKFIS